MADGVLFYRVTGHSGRAYVVRRLAAGDWRCECPAWRWGRGCKHVLASQAKFICGWEGSFDFPSHLELEPRPPRVRRRKAKGSDC